LRKESIHLGNRNLHHPPELEKATRQLLTPMASRSNQGKRKSPPAVAPHDVATSSKKKGKQATVPPSSGCREITRNFSKMEDQMLCRAYVNVSCNPITATIKRRAAFWEAIKTKYEELYDKKNVVKEDPKVERPLDALANRYQKKIQPEMNLFMPFFKRVRHCPPSDMPKEEWPAIAATNFHKHYNRPFKFLHYVFILKQLPKFDPEGLVMMMMTRTQVQQTRLVIQWEPTWHVLLGRRLLRKLWLPGNLKRRD
jgi:hypothetical protein